MGRRKRIATQVKKGSIYFVDRRFERILIYRQILSRQKSKNHNSENLVRFFIRQAPVNTTLMVTGHHTFFGREYIKVIAANSDQETMIGYMHLQDFKQVVCGFIEYVIVG